MIAEGLEHMDEAVQVAWRAMRIEPEKWQCSPWGNDGGGFWAVGERDGQVIWYNDIEHGFNVSRFSSRGTIDEYWCNQDGFDAVLLRLPEATEAERWDRAGDTRVPFDLREGGQIVHRQTTYWEVRSRRGTPWRLHFRSKAEARFLEPGFSSVDLVDAHPILDQYREPWSSLFFSGTTADPERAKRALAERVSSASSGWRLLDEYLNVGADMSRGYGLLMHAPASLVEAAIAVLGAAGITTSVLDGVSPAERPRALILGRNFILAQEFRFEARG